MTWYVWIGRVLHGWVIAATERDAIDAAHRKFEPTIEDDAVTVRLREGAG